MQRMDVWNHDVICTPSLILQPKSDLEVSDCLKGYTTGVHKCLSANRRHGAKFAIPRLCVAGGRNSYNAMRDGSVVIDLSKMRSVKVDVQAQTVKVQGGARTIDVDAALGEYGLMAVLGTCQHLGVVGSVLGGGLGFASRKYGLACDNVIQASVILADGRLKKCNLKDHRELLWGVCGGGGGIGIVVSLTLKCHPLRHAALLTFDMPTMDMNQSRKTVRHWANWINGDVDNDGLSGNDIIVKSDAAADEVFSQIMLPSNSNSISFLGSSIDTKAISQTDGYIEMYSNAEKKSKKRGGLFKFMGGGDSEQNIPSGWAEIPSLGDLITNKFESTRKHSEFRMVRYADQLQSYSNEYFTPGNIFSSIKYAKSMTNRIVEVLVQATSSEIAPRNESNIVIMAMNGQIGKNRLANKTTSFSARDMNYMIYIEGKWEAGAEHRKQKEKTMVSNWVNWVVNQLHLCEGIQSSVHPESMRDQVSKSGRSKPPSGWYNFKEGSGRKLDGIKLQRDPRNVFSFASRVSWSRSLSGPIDLDADDNTFVTGLSEADHVKDGEIQPTECTMFPQSHQSSAGRTTGNGSGTDIVGVKSTDDFEDASDDNDEFDIENKMSEVSANGEEEASIGSDVMRLLSLTDSDEDLKDWSFAPITLQRNDFDASAKQDVTSPHSVDADFVGAEDDSIASSL